MFKTIVIGGTGATGKHLLHQLISDKNCELVTSIGRRPVLDGEKNDKLVDIVVDSLFKLTATEKYWKNNDDFVLSKLSERLINRRILKIKVTNQSISDEKKTELITKFMQKNNCTNEEANFFIFSNKASNSTYNIEKSNINILMKTGEVIDITSASDQFDIDALNKTVNKYFLCYPNNL